MILVPDPITICGKNVVTELFLIPQNRRCVTVKYHLTKIKYDGVSFFLIWFNDEEDGFLLFESRLLTFFSKEEATAYANRERIFFEAGMTVFDLTNVLELINTVEISQSCRTLIDTWHFFSDLSKSVKESFMGDVDDEEIMDVYNKLIYGSNLRLLKNEEYHPCFNEKEVRKCSEVFCNGLSILKKHVDFT